jgi:Uma2 family endonuclease
MPREIVLPDAEPEFEWILGRAVQKMSPKRRHALLQGELLMRLSAWARGHGEVGPEWRFRLEPPGEDIRPLVPDIAYLSYQRMGDASDDDLEAPRMAPNIAVEIRSAGERQAHLDHKTLVYLTSGTDAVLIVDPLAKTIDVFDRTGSVHFAIGDSFAHPALPGLSFTLAEVFAVLHRPR